MANWIDVLAERVRLFADKLQEGGQPRYDTDRPTVNDPNTTRRIKSENPPQIRNEQIDSHNASWSMLQTLFYGCLALAVILILASAFTGNITVLFIVLIGAGFGIKYLVQQEKLLDAQHQKLSEPIFLDAYNTDFVCPLADRSTIRATVHFQIPRELNNPPYGNSTSPSHFVEQLNRVTEAKLIPYTHQFTEPPTRHQLEGYLQVELAQFQDENHVSVLRVNVPLVIHVHPDKPPKEVHV